MNWENFKSIGKKVLLKTTAKALLKIVCLPLVCAV